MLSCLVSGDPIEYAFTVKVDIHETISELKEIIKSKKQNKFDGVDANELILWKIDFSLDELKQIIHKNDSLTDIKRTLNGEQLLPLDKVGKAFPNELANDHIHVIVQHNKHEKEKVNVTIWESISQILR